MRRDSVKKTTNKSLLKKDHTKDGHDEIKNTYKTNYQSSESVIKQILDRIITYAIRSSQAKEIDEKMGDFCFNHLKLQMTSLFETNFINYTDDLVHENPPMCWELISPPENTWVELPEPGSQEIDRYESSNIEFIEIRKDQQQEGQTQKSPIITKPISSNDKKINKKKVNFGKKEA